MLLEETQKEKERTARNAAESLLLDSAPSRIPPGWQWTDLRPVPQRPPRSAEGCVSAECTLASLSRHPPKPFGTAGYATMELRSSTKNHL